MKPSRHCLIGPSDIVPAPNLVISLGAERLDYGPVGLVHVHDAFQPWHANVVRIDAERRERGAQAVEVLAQPVASASQAWS